MPGQPLNGTDIHPLSRHALDVLASLSRGPQPRQSINPGVRARLQAEDLIEMVDLPSPYAAHRRKPIPFLRITDAGLAALEANR